MSELRNIILEAHGIAKWKTVNAIDVDLSVTGLLWARKGWPDVFKDVHATAQTRNQHVSFTPFTAEGLRSVYSPDEVVLETTEGKVVKSRIEPRAAFDGHTPETRWDELHLAYFGGYAMWNYLNTPFIFASPDFVAEEIEPWDEAGDKRRRLKVTFPSSIATHCSEQIFHINSEGLIARVDYQAPVTGGGGVPTALYVSDYKDFNGIKLWAKRRAHLRNPDGTPDTGAIGVAIDATNIRLS
jgi:hypothetical protein